MRPNWASGKRPYYQDDLVTIYHGDALEILPALQLAGVLVFDPPYGVKLDSGMNGRHGRSTIANDHSTELRDKILEICSDWPAIAFGSPKVAKPAGTKATLVWDKGEHVGMGDLAMPWKPNWEEIYVLGGGFVGKRTGSVLKVLAVAGCVGTRTWRHHATEKPVGLMRMLIEKCPPTRIVVDPTMGSGTTLVAAKELSRPAIGIECEERHCWTAAQRCAEMLPLYSPNTKPSGA